MGKPRKKARARVPSRDNNGEQMKEIRCANNECKKFLGYELLEVGLIHIACRKCKSITKVTTLPEEIPEPTELRDVRCGLCGRYLYREAIISGTVKVKCPNCGEWNTLRVAEEEILTTARSSHAI